jgi:hypothetical protein
MIEGSTNQQLRLRTRILLSLDNDMEEDAERARLGHAS